MFLVRHLLCCHGLEEWGGASLVQFPVEWSGRAAEHFAEVVGLLTAPAARSVVWEGLRKGVAEWERLDDSKEGTEDKKREEGEKEKETDAETKKEVNGDNTNTEEKDGKQGERAVEDEAAVEQLQLSEGDFMELSEQIPIGPFCTYLEECGGSSGGCGVEAGTAAGLVGSLLRSLCGALPAVKRYTNFSKIVIRMIIVLLTFAAKSPAAFLCKGGTGEAAAQREFDAALLSVKKQEHTHMNTQLFIICYYLSLITDVCLHTHTT